MKIFSSRTKNLLYLIYRLIRPIFDPVSFCYGLVGYPGFIWDILRYKTLAPSSQICNDNLYPILHEKIRFTPFDAHYFYQQLWTFERVLLRKPKRHVDIGSTYSMSGYISKITNAVFVDIRPIQTSLKNLNIVEGDLVRLPFADNSIDSLSCLSVVEHIGLGRYGDPIDPLGTEKACHELSRVLAKGGRLYLSVPLGKNRICFNAHRVHNPQTMLAYCKGLKLTEFSVVDDEGQFHEKIDYKKFSDLSYGCGLFEFSK